jgi:hypothetical protein
MPGSGSRMFLEPDHYEASLRQAQIGPGGIQWRARGEVPMTRRDLESVTLAMGDGLIKLW